jgi:hypothetical protein
MVARLALSRASGDSTRGIRVIELVGVGPGRVFLTGVSGQASIESDAARSERENDMIATRRFLPGLIPYLAFVLGALIALLAR